MYCRLLHTTFSLWSSSSSPSPSSSCLSFLPMARRANVLCLSASVIVTLLTTVIIGVTVLSDYWEIVHYSREIVDDLVQKAGGAYQIDHLFNGKVIVVKKNAGEDADADVDAATANASTASVEVLVQMHAGLWTTCIDLTDDELSHLEALYPNQTKERCFDQLVEQDKYVQRTSGKSRQIRMRNLSISCSLVCLVILVACLVVFWVGLIERQVPPVFVVSVLYLLAAVFATFSLMIARYRRRAPASLDCGVLDAQVSPLLLPSRSFQMAWSVYLGWVGVAFCLLSAVCVYSLSILMRNTPFVV